MKALVTGINGFAGSHLAEYLLGIGVIVHGTVRRRSGLENIEKIKDQIHLHECDFRDSHSVDSMIEGILPDKIFHLAAQSFVPTSWKIPTETFESNVIGTLNLLESVRHVRNYDPIIQIAGSSEEYGAVLEEELPIKESNLLRPLSPYAVSKVAQDMLGYQYHKSYGMKIIRTRAFNHSGARRPSDFVDSGFARQIAMIEGGLAGEVRHGNLKAVRDFSDVRDVVRAYWIVTETDQFIGEAVNICSGVGWEISKVLETLVALSDARIETQEDESRNRPSDVPILIGDNSKLKDLWKPEYKYETTLSDMLDWWRMRT